MCIPTFPSATLIGMSKKRRPAISTSVFLIPVFARLGHGRLLPVRAVKATAPSEDLGQRTEQNMLEKVSEFVSGIPKDEAESAFLH
jgi:hypothetical protein